MPTKKVISLASVLSIFLVLIIVTFFSFSNLTKAQNPTYNSNVATLKDIVTAGFSFTKDLQLGDTDPDVKELQKVLNADPDTIVADYDSGSKGYETTYFGSATKAAVIKFQNKYKDIVLTLNGITVANGVVNKATRTRLNLLIGVINTYDSVGLPQNRGPVSVAVPFAPVIVSSQPAMTSCQLVELLISIGAIASDKTTQARNAFNCPVPQSNMTSCQLVELLINIGAIVPNKATQARLAMNCIANNNGNGSINNIKTISNPLSVDLKVNGQSGTLYLNSIQNVTISWTSSNANSCVLANQTVSLSGFENYYIGNSQTIVITCNNSNSQVSVTIPVVLNASATTVTSTSSTQSVSVDLKINSGDDNYFNASAGQYLISWSSQKAISCIGSSLPVMAGWNNSQKLINSFELVNVSTSTIFNLVCSDALGNSATDSGIVAINSSQFVTSDSSTATTATTIPTGNSSGSTAFGGTVVWIFPCVDSKNTPIPHKFELGILGYPAPGVRVLYDLVKSLPPVGVFVLGTASGSYDCKTLNPTSVVGFKKAGVMKMFGFSS